MQAAHRKILIIDDDEQGIRIIQELLGANSDFPINIFHCFTIEDSIELLQSDTSIDLVLLNLHIASAQGLENFYQINQACPIIPVIVLSGNTDETLTLKAIQAGAQDYLVKECLTSRLLHRSIQYVLERQSLLTNLDHKTQELELLSVQLEAANQRLEALTTIDSLTQINNRRCFDETFLSEWNRLCREHHPLSLILCDVDYFKAYNNTYGHQAGDNCLRDIAQAIAKVVKRPADCVARYGGEKLAVILPNTDLEGAIQVAESIRTAIKTLAIPHQSSSIGETISVSVGVASQVPNDNVAPSILIEAADRALYVAKQQGRDCVQTHQKDCSSLESRRTLELVDRLQNALKQQQTRRRRRLRIKPGAIFTP